MKASSVRYAGQQILGTIERIKAVQKELALIEQFKSGMSQMPNQMQAVDPYGQGKGVFPEGTSISTGQKDFSQAVNMPQFQTKEGMDMLMKAMAVQKMSQELNKDDGYTLGADQVRYSGQNKPVAFGVSRPEPQGTRNLRYIPRKDEKGKTVTEKFGSTLRSIEDEYDMSTGQRTGAWKYGEGGTEPSAAYDKLFIPDLNGEPLLKKLLADKSIDPGTANSIRQAAQYKLDPQKMTSMRGNQREQFTKLISMYDPNYDVKWASGYSALVRDANTGNIARNSRSLNTVIGHLETLKKLSAELDNGQWTDANAVKNWIRTHAGDPAVTNFSTVLNAVATEKAATLKGGASGAAPTEMEIAAEKENIFNSMSQKQIDGYIQTSLELFGSRMGALQQQLDRLPSKPLGFDLLSQPSQRILSDWGFDYQKYLRGEPSQVGGGTKKPVEQMTIEELEAELKGAK
jgi:hypothetical protein